jgi:hypothetical protein
MKNISLILPSPEIAEEKARKLVHFLGKRHLPLQMRMDLLDVFCGLRPAARVLVKPEGEAHEVCQDILSIGFSIAVGKGVKWQPKSSGVTCHDWFSEKSNSTTFESMAVIYVAASQEEAEQTKAADETRDDVVFAHALGYPNCCIEWVNERKCVPELSECIELYASQGTYDPLIWPGAMLNDAPLTPHYPCSAICRLSKALAQARVDLLVKLGCFEILERIIRAREVVYYIDVQQKLCSVSTADFIASDHNPSAKPSISPAKGLNIVQ